RQPGQADAGSRNLRRPGLRAVVIPAARLAMGAARPGFGAIRGYRACPAVKSAHGGVVRPCRWLIVPRDAAPVRRQPHTDPGVPPPGAGPAQPRPTPRPAPPVPPSQGPPADTACAAPATD